MRQALVHPRAVFSERIHKWDLDADDNGMRGGMGGGTLTELLLDLYVVGQSFWQVRNLAASPLDPLEKSVRTSFPHLLSVHTLFCLTWFLFSSLGPGIHAQTGITAFYCQKVQLSCEKSEIVDARAKGENR